MTLQWVQHPPGARAIEDVLIIHEQDRSRAAGSGHAAIRAVTRGIQQGKAEQKQEGSGAHDDCLSERGGSWQVCSAWACCWGWVLRKAAYASCKPPTSYLKATCTRSGHATSFHLALFYLSSSSYVALFYRVFLGVGSGDPEPSQQHPKRHSALRRQCRRRPFQLS